MLRPPPSYSVAVRSLSSPLSPERPVGNTLSNGTSGGRVNLHHHHHRHHHRHSNHIVSHSANNSGGHSITVTTNRSHGACPNSTTSVRAISHPQLTPKSQASSTASVSVSVTPRRAAGERIPTCNINGSG